MKQYYSVVNQGLEYFICPTCEKLYLVDYDNFYNNHCFHLKSFKSKKKVLFDNFFKDFDVPCKKIKLEPLHIVISDDDDDVLDIKIENLVASSLDLVASVEDPVVDLNDPTVDPIGYSLDMDKVIGNLINDKVIGNLIDERSDNATFNEFDYEIGDEEDVLNEYFENEMQNGGSLSVVFMTQLLRLILKIIIKT